ncbi:MAG: hypothetical protein KDC52_10590 [Ignavibacteriae bacterium]|nr:hypothetical protein [Ignavibacteriota bacterium]
MFAKAARAVFFINLSLELTRGVICSTAFSHFKFPKALTKVILVFPFATGNTLRNSLAALFSFIERRVCTAGSQSSSSTKYSSISLIDLSVPIKFNWLSKKVFTSTFL